MSAVRMVAYGVLELKHKEPSSLWIAEQSPEEQVRLHEENRQRDELRKLVNDELKRYGLLLTRAIVAKGDRWRTKANAHVLYGQVRGSRGFKARETLHEGSFKECCVTAAELLDKMEDAREA
jgi:hypothetical protein